MFVMQHRTAGDLDDIIYIPVEYILKKLQPYMGKKIFEQNWDLLCSLLMEL